MSAPGRRGSFVFSAKGAVSFKPGVSPQELRLPTEQALKARFNLVGLASFH